MTTDAPDPAGDPRLERLVEGLHQVQAERSRWSVERVLVLLAGALVPIGIGLVLVGWHGASRTPNVYEQIPYVISGAELGQTLAVVGALLYFAHWIAALVREQRRQGNAVVAAIAHLEGSLVEALSGDGGVSAGSGAGRLVATARGGLAHRPDCSAVAGRTGLRELDAGAEGLAPCRLCLPDGFGG